MREVELIALRAGIGLLALGMVWLIGTVVRRGIEMAEMRQQIAHLPDRECTQQLALSIEKLSGHIDQLGAQIDAGRERMDRAERSIERMERWLYERGL